MLNERNGIFPISRDLNFGDADKAAYFVMAKMDEGDAPFDENTVNENFPENYMLVPGHVWLVVTDAEGSYEVAKSLGLVSGGLEEASGMVVPARGYWGFAHKRLWQLFQPDGSNDSADPVGRRTVSRIAR